MFARVSGLKLKAPKCVLIPLSIVTSDANISAIRSWLHHWLPEWTHFRIASSGKYLGIYLGLSAGAKQWEAPLDKLKARTDEIHAAKLPAFKAAARFTSRAVPVLAYVGQVSPPPDRFASMELAAATKVLGFATNALNTDEAYSLELLGGIKMTRPLHFLVSAMVRAAAKTLSGHTEMAAALRKETELAHPLCCLNVVSSSPPGWDSEAFCVFLSDALEGKFKGISQARGDRVLGSIGLSRTSPRGGA